MQDPTGSPTQRTAHLLVGEAGFCPQEPFQRCAWPQAHLPALLEGEQSLSSGHILRGARPLAGTRKPGAYPLTSQPQFYPVPGDTPGEARGPGPAPPRPVTWFHFPRWGEGRLGGQRAGLEAEANSEPLSLLLPLQPARPAVPTQLCQPRSVIRTSACQSQDLEQGAEGGGRERREGGGAGEGEGEGASQSSAFPSDRREGNTHHFPFSSASRPKTLVSVPSPLDRGWHGWWAGQGAGAQVPSPLGSGLAPSRAWQAPWALTRHALLLVREASPSCFQSFITVLFVVQQIKFFWRPGWGWGGSEGEGGGKARRRENAKSGHLGPRDERSSFLNAESTCLGERPAARSPCSLLPHPRPSLPSRPPLHLAGDAWSQTFKATSQGSS